MTSLLVAILLLGILVFVHEFGHFIVAKISGMRVETFSIGMGPAVATYQRGETEYVFGAIPAGGFVSVTGIASDVDDDMENDDPRRYQNKSILQRALFAAAGPAMNFIFAIVILIVVFMSVGTSVPKTDLDTVISSVTKGSPADQAGLQAGDKIVQIGEEAVSSWRSLNKAVSLYKGAAVPVVFERQQKHHEVVIEPNWDKSEGQYILGVSREMEFEHRKLHLSEAVNLSLRTTQSMSKVILDAVKNLVTGHTSINDKDEGLTGPVGIVKVIDETTAQGVWNVLMLMAVLSINLGLLNLLPIPALDGSRLLFLVLEAVRGKPVSAEKEGLVNFIGFAGLMFLMIYVTYNDIARLL